MTVPHPVRGRGIRNVALASGAAARLLPLVGALVVDPADRARLSTNLAGHAEVVFAGTLAEARALVRDQPNLVAVIVQPTDRDGRLTAGWIRVLVRTYPSLAVIGYCRPRVHTGQDIFSFGSAGAHDLMFHGIDDLGAGLRCVLSSSSQAARAERILAALADLLPGRAASIVDYCLHYPRQAHTVQAVANALGYNRKTLSKYCASRGLLSPEALVSWSRLFLAAVMLAQGTSTVESVALELDFSAAAGLRNLLRRHAGLGIQDLRSGGLRALVPLFQQRLEEQARRRPRGA